MNEFGIILNTQEMRQIIRTISNHSRWIRHPSFPDKLTARFRLQSGETIRAEYTFPHETKAFVDIIAMTENYLLMQNKPALEKLTMRVRLDDDKTQFVIIRPPAEKKNMEWLRRKTKVTISGKELDGEEFLAILFAVTEGARGLPGAFHVTETRPGEVWFSPRENFKDALVAAVIQERKTMLTKGFDTITMNQKQFAKMQELLEQTSFETSQWNYDELPLRKFCFRLVQDHTMVYTYHAFEDGLVISVDAEDVLTENVSFIAKIKVLDQPGENGEYAEVTFKPDSTMTARAQAYMDQPAGEGAEMTNAEWCVHTFIGLTYFLLHFGDVSMDVEEKIAKEPTKEKGRGAKQKAPPKVRLFKSYTLKKNWVSRVNRKKAEITCPAWGVRGHYRHYRNGKTVFVQAYVKGRDRANYAGKEYELLPAEIKTAGQDEAASQSA
ncbi:MAG: hypothetical protein IJ188_03030 [Clostridia bacterium]|nr:hypothetical protein [Clostridia bacterium]